MRSIFRNTSLSSLQGDSLAASFASSCEKYPRKSLSTFYLRLVLQQHHLQTSLSVSCSYERTFLMLSVWTSCITLDKLFCLFYYTFVENICQHNCAWSKQKRILSYAVNKKRLRILKQNNEQIQNGIKSNDRAILFGLPGHLSFRDYVRQSLCPFRNRIICM